MNVMIYFLFFLSVTYYYLGPYRVIALAAYLFSAIIIIFRLKINVLDVVVAFILLVLIGYHYLIYPEFKPLAYAVRLNFGVLMFYFLFRSVKWDGINIVAIILSVWTIAEYILIRTYPGIIGSLYNYDGSFFLDQTERLTGGVHSFGGNRTVTAVILVAVYLFLENYQPHRRFKNLPLFASLICFSGTAYMLLAFALFWQYRKNQFIIPIAACFALIFFSAELFGVYFVSKFSHSYMLDVLAYKLNQINQAGILLQADAANYIWGRGFFNIGTESTEVSGYGGYFGDFIMLDFVVKFGFVGVVIYALILAKSVNARNFIAVTVMIVGTLHYHVMFSLIGQFVLGYILAAGHTMNASQSKISVMNSGNAIVSDIDIVPQRHPLKV